MPSSVELSLGDRPIFVHPTALVTSWHDVCTTFVLGWIENVNFVLLGWHMGDRRCFSGSESQMFF